MLSSLLCAFLVLCGFGTATADATCPAAEREGRQWTPFEDVETKRFSEDAGPSSWTDDSPLVLFQRAAHMKVKLAGGSDKVGQDKPPVVGKSMVKTTVTASNHSGALNATKGKLDQDLEAAINCLARWGKAFGQAPTSPVQGVNVLARLLVVPLRLTTRMGLPWQLALFVILSEFAVVLFLVCVVLQASMKRKRAPR